MTDLERERKLVKCFRHRVLIAVLMVCIGFLMLFMRLYYLQVVRYHYYHSRAEGNRIALLPVVPGRGTIIDRNGEILARNYSAYTLELNPSQVKNVDETIEALGRIVPISGRDIRNFRDQAAETRYFDSVPVRTHLNDNEAAALAARRFRFPGVEVQARFFRDYPFAESTAHIVGYIGRINKDELDRLETSEQTANYRGSKLIGKTGLESYYEKELHGQTGIEQVEINAGGRAVRLLQHLPATPGKNLTLTLDIRLQQAVEKIMGERRGAVVVLDPKNGEILALVSRPGYNPNLFVEGISYADWEAIRTSPHNPLINRAIGNAYPPGSTFKPFVALAGLAAGKRTPEQRFNNQGVFRYADLVLFDRKSKCQNGVDLLRSLTYSCNVYYYQLADDLGIDALSESLSQFGFGRKMGIDLPGEIAGVLPSRQWKQSNFAKAEQQRWYGGETLFVGIGQGYNEYTPLQMASAVATLANGGVRYTPHLLRAVTDPVTGMTEPVSNEPHNVIELDPKFIQAVWRGMAGVIHEGTAANAFANVLYQAAGKTGTAQVASQRGKRYDVRTVPDHLRDHAWFIGFAPLENPQVAIAVFIENGGFGAAVAAPVARQIFDYILVDSRFVGPQQPAEAKQ